MNLISKEIQIIKNQASDLLSKKDDIMKELNTQRIAMSVISTEHLICTISIIPKPKDNNQEIKLFEELNKMSWNV